MEIFVCVDDRQGSEKMWNLTHESPHSLVGWYHTLTEYGREVTAFIVAFLPVSEDCIDPLPASSDILFIPKNSDDALETPLESQMSVVGYDHLLSGGLRASLPFEMISTYIKE
ncbi:hypothetical protein EVAR_51872_1 [Eumeta japonica]|uniref:Uncharacterized protein n=1 Tax=Eumeta variegata TaxID=151549 RepID=A0A4C1YIS2_EUMVA|nr:hypothetical protein EVAR_51872_1 [Eumeta japonica]